MKNIQLTKSFDRNLFYEKAENFTDPSERQDSVVIGESNAKFDFDMY